MRTVLAASAAVLLFPAPTHAAGAALSSLVTDVRQAETSLLQLKGQVEQIRGDLAAVDKTLGIPDTVASDINKLETVLKDLSLILLIAEDVPQIRTEAQQLKARLDDAVKVIDDAQKTAQGVADKIAPVRAKLEQGISACDSVDSKIDTVAGDIDNRFLPGVDKANQCIAQAKPAVQQCLAGKLDDAAAAARPGVQAVDLAAKNAARALGDVNGVVTDVEQTLSSLDPIRQTVNAIEKGADLIYHPMQEVQKILGQKVEVEFPYPDPKKGNPFHMGKYKVGISIKTALKGPQEIEKEIQKILTGELYKAAKLFGMKRMIESLMTDAQKAMDGALRDLHLDLSVDIPGLSALTKLEGKLGGWGTSLESKLQMPVFDTSSLQSARDYVTTQACKNAACPD